LKVESSAGVVNVVGIEGFPKLALKASAEDLSKSIVFKALTKAVHSPSAALTSSVIKSSTVVSPSDSENPVFFAVFSPHDDKEIESTDRIFICRPNLSLIA
jgi:hypothetical protein